MVSHKIPALALAALIGSGVAIGTASAMPLSGLAPAQKQITEGVQDVRWVCGPYRCWWQPGPYWGGGPGWGPHPWRGGWRWHWHRHYW
jgi:hypothetical protein